MPNLRFLACSVWAVGGVVRKSVCAFYIRRKLVTLWSWWNCNQTNWSNIKATVQPRSRNDRKVITSFLPVQITEEWKFALRSIHSNWRAFMDLQMGDRCVTLCWPCVIVSFPLKPTKKRSNGWELYSNEDNQVIRFWMNTLLINRLTQYWWSQITYEVYPVPLLLPPPPPKGPNCLRSSSEPLSLPTSMWIESTIQPA